MAKLLLIFVLFMFSSQSKAQTNFKVTEFPAQRIDVRYRLFDTENYWNKLLLDTRTGKLWQVSYTVEEGGVRAKIPLNEENLVSDGKGVNGRFTLYPTPNIWTFILVDQENGNVWQCGFAIDPELFMGIIPILVE